MTTRIVIVGNGVAGIEAAIALRKLEPTWDLAIVSEESDHLFSRTALMYVLAGQMRYRDIEPYERDLYARLGFRRIRARATALDTAAHTLTLASGEKLPYDRLLLATGSRPRPAPWPGAELRGVGHFVTLQDLAWLERELHGGPAHDAPPNALAHLRDGATDSPYALRPAAADDRKATAQRPVVIGGGLIGIEAVETMLAARRAPVFLVREEWFWPIALDGRESAWIADALRAHGVDVRVGHAVDRLVGDPRGNLAAVVANGAEIPADLAVVAIGVQPNTGWLGDAVARDAGGGLLVDAQLRTSAPDVFAAGDCASVAWFDGRRRPEQLWYTARDQGRVAARNLHGDTAPYQRGIWYNSAKLMDVEYTTVGLVGTHAPGEREWWFAETGAVRSTLRVPYVVDSEAPHGRILGFNALGRRWDHSAIARWIADRRPIRWVLAHLADARFDTELVPPLRLPPGALADLPG